MGSWESTPVVWPSSLSLAELKQLNALLLTHQHFDHIRDIPTIGLAAFDEPNTIDLYAISETLNVVHTNLLNGNVYPDFTKPLRGGSPKFRFNPVQPDTSFNVLDYKVRAIPMPHSAPTVGYRIASPAGEHFAYTGDTGGNLLPFLDSDSEPNILFLEVSFSGPVVRISQQHGASDAGVFAKSASGSLIGRLEPSENGRGAPGPREPG